MTSFRKSYTLIAFYCCVLFKKTFCVSLMHSKTEVYKMSRLWIFNRGFALLREKKKMAFSDVLPREKRGRFLQESYNTGLRGGGFLDFFSLSRSCFESRKDNIMIWSQKLHYSMVLFFSLQSLTETRVSSQFDLSVWVRSSFTAMPLAGVILPSPIQGLHEVVQPTSPNITIASHLPWILSCSIATAHSHSIPFPFLQGPHKVNPNLFARDGLIITLTCLASCSLHRDNRVLLLIHMLLFALYFIYLD